VPEAALQIAFCHRPSSVEQAVADFKPVHGSESGGGQIGAVAADNLARSLRVELLNVPSEGGEQVADSGHEEAAVLQ
jgi:hypothetical protein